MRIMLITQLPPPSGGIATWSKKYIDYCEKNQIEVSVVNNAMIGKRGSDFHAKKDLLTEIKRTLRVIRRIIRVKRDFLPTVVHFNTACSSLGVIRDYLCSLFIGRSIPIVLHCRCTIQDQLKNNRIGVFFFKALLRRVETVLVLNDVSKEYVKSLGNNNINIKKVPNFIDVSYIVDHEKATSETIRHVLYTGHVQKMKGIDEILEVASQTPDIQYTLVGQIDTRYEHITIPSNVHFLGRQPPEKVKDLLDQSDVFLFPSYTEGFANSLAEAMARGLPCIASSAGANADMLEGKGGLIVPIADSKAIIEALKKINSRDVRASMSAWNISKMRGAYVIDKVIGLLLDIYKEASK